MIRTLFTSILLLSAGLASAAPLPAPSCFTPGKKFDNRMAGNWEIEPLNVRYSIRAKGREVCMYARDAQADEFFDIRELQWDGKVLQVTFYLPSTKWQTQSRLTVEGSDRIRDEYTNRDGKFTDYWTRRK